MNPYSHRKPNSSPQIKGAYVSHFMLLRSQRWSVFTPIITAFVNNRYPGVPSLWGGLSASIVRQATYSSARFGLYNFLADQAKQWTGKEKLSMNWTITCAGTAGGLAGLFGNPAEVNAYNCRRDITIY